MEIAETARRVFHVRLKVKDGVAITPETVAREALKFDQQKRAGLLLCDGQNLRVKLLEKGFIAIEEAAIQHGEMKFGIILLDLLAFVDGAARGADPESQIPKHAGEFRDQRPRFFLDLLVGKQEEKVQV